MAYGKKFIRPISISSVPKESSKLLVRTYPVLYLAGRPAFQDWCGSYGYAVSPASGFVFTSVCLHPARFLTPFLGECSINVSMCGITFSDRKNGSTRTSLSLVMYIRTSQLTDMKLRRLMLTDMKLRRLMC